MNAGRRITQKDVAQAAGTDQPTVSLALRNHPRVPEEIRRHVAAVAERLGYHPDPMLAALADYRSQRRPTDFRGTLGWLADSRQDPGWRQNRQLLAFHAAASVAAEKAGYRLDIFDLKDMNVGWPQAGRIAQARGVQGIILCSQPRPETRLESFPWEDFPAVTFDSTLDYPRLDSVGAAHGPIMMQILDQMWIRGYRRIGLALRPDHDHRLAYSYSAAYLAYHHKHSDAIPLPICPDDGHESDGEVLRAWLGRHSADALISASNVHLAARLAEWGLKVPDDLGLACPVLLDTDETLSGVQENAREIGRVAVQLLIDLIQSGERGHPSSPKRMLVSGIWKPGRTLREAVVPA